MGDYVIPFMKYITFRNVDRVDDNQRAYTFTMRDDESLTEAIVRMFESMFEHDIDHMRSYVTIENAYDAYDINVNDVCDHTDDALIA